MQLASYQIATGLIALAAPAPRPVTAVSGFGSRAVMRLASTGSPTTSYGVVRH